MASAQKLTDHEQIRGWADERGAGPACVKGTGGQNDTGMIRLDFPGFGGAESLQPISWDDWFRQFDENNLALLVQETTSSGQKSNFNKLVSRTTASSRRGAPRRQAARRGRTAKSKTAATRRSTAKARLRGTRAISARSRRSGAKTASRRKQTSGRARSGRR
jgi:hypothetical protein